MLRRIPRFLRRTVLVAVVLAVSAAVFQSWSSGAPGTGGWTQTQWGPLGPADRDLLIKVRQANLWEGPTGQQAQQLATSPAVREVGGKLGVEHADLDVQTRAVANELGIALPSSPSGTQMSWMADISSRTGAEYDRVFIQRVREAHGIVLPVIAAVRIGTRNDKVRAFAELADSFVSRHCQYLESTGLVNYSALPTPPSPGLLSGSTDPKDLILPIVVFVLTVLGAIALFSALRARGSKQPARLTVPREPLSAAAALPALASVAALPGSRGSPEVAPPPMLESGHHRDREDADYLPESYEHETYQPADTVRAAPREYRSSATGTYRPVTGETETFRAITESDVFRPVTDSGGYRAVTDSGGYSAYSEPESGNHRVWGKSRSRHSIRR